MIYLGIFKDLCCCIRSRFICESFPVGCWLWACWHKWKQPPKITTHSKLDISFICSELASSCHSWIQQNLNTEVFIAELLCRMAFGRYCILPANWICITLWLPFFSFPLVSVNRSPICTDQTNEPKELRWTLRRGLRRRSCESCTSLPSTEMRIAAG